MPRFTTASGKRVAFGPSSVDKARQYGLQHGAALAKGDQHAADVWRSRFLRLPANHDTRLAFEWASRDAQKKRA